MVVLYGVFGPVNTKGRPTVVVEESPNDRSQSENTNTTLVNKVINNSFHINKIIPLFSSHCVLVSKEKIYLGL